MDTSPSFSASLVDKSFTLAVMIKSFTLAVMMGFVCLTVGSTPDTCFGDVLHLVGLPGFPLIHLSHARAVVMVPSLSGFSTSSQSFGATRR